MEGYRFYRMKTKQIGPILFVNFFSIEKVGYIGVFHLPKPLKLVSAWLEPPSKPGRFWFWLCITHIKHMMTKPDAAHFYQRTPSVGMPRHALRRRMPNISYRRGHSLGRPDRCPTNVSRAFWVGSHPARVWEKAKLYQAKCSIMEAISKMAP